MLTITKQINNNVTINKNGLIQDFNPNDDAIKDRQNPANILIYPKTGSAAPYTIYIPPQGLEVTLITPSSSTTGIYNVNTLYTALKQDFFFSPY